MFMGVAAAPASSGADHEWHIVFNTTNTTACGRVVFRGAAAIHLTGPQLAAPKPRKAAMTYALPTLVFIGLLLAGTATVLAGMLVSLERRLRGLNIALTSDF